jgi:hypothetical protein
MAAEQAPGTSTTSVDAGQPTNPDANTQAQDQSNAVSLGNDKIYTQSAAAR